MTEATSTFGVSELIAALDIPSAAFINQRIPKKLFIENGAPTTVDKKLIQDGIEEITWIAALKPANAGIPEYQDEQRTYLELAVLSVALKQGAGEAILSAKHVSRVTELVHRAIPYPVVLVLDQTETTCISMAHIRWAQQEADKTVLDGPPIEASLPKLKGLDANASQTLLNFLQSLPLARQPRANLYTLYQGWIDTLTAWQVAQLTGNFEVSETPELAAKRRAAFHRCQEIDAQIASLRIAAGREKQVARQVAINLEIKALRADRAQAAACL
jgi:hypothetical protein